VVGVRLEDSVAPLLLKDSVALPLLNWVAAFFFLSFRCKQQ
jgi:hypothetical protein